MPNGHDWDVEETRRIKAFFSRLETEMEAFAKVRHVSIDCYYHGSPSWDFRFRHPLGGVGQISLACVDEQKGVVHLAWWKDSYDEGVRYLRTKSWPERSFAAADVSPVLSEALLAILKWDGSRMTPHPGYKENWHRGFSRQDFEEQERHYPSPTIG